MEEALFLTRFATKVTIVHRRDRFRASKIMQERALSHEKIQVAWNSVVEEVLGDEFVTGLRIADVGSGESRELPAEALFIAIGHQPNTQLFEGQLDLDPSGYIHGSNQTSPHTERPPEYRSCSAHRLGRQTPRRASFARLCQKLVGREMT